MVDTAFLKLSETNSTQLSMNAKRYDNGTIYYSATIKQTIAKNMSYDLILIIKKNTNNDKNTNFATYPQKIMISLGNYYSNNFNPFIGFLTNINFDSKKLNNASQNEFDTRYESYVILIIFSVIAFGFLVGFIFMKIGELKHKIKVSFQPLAKNKQEDLKEMEMEIINKEKETH